jgi:Uma2 family endonuclease
MAIAVPPKPELTNMEDLIDFLGGIPPSRIRLWPAPGTAVEQDVVDIDAHEDRLCELIDGVLVEKTVGYYESVLGSVLGGIIRDFVRKHRLGAVAGEGGMMGILPGQVRIPDVSFVSKHRFPNGKRPIMPIPNISPDLAVEVLSESNTMREMDRKLKEYFEAGTSLVWYVDAEARTISVYTSPTAMLVLSEDNILDGGDVLSGFQVRVGDVFEEADESFSE